MSLPQAITRGAEMVQVGINRLAVTASQKVCMLVQFQFVGRNISEKLFGNILKIG